jgi:hypothetical protein
MSVNVKVDGRRKGYDDTAEVRYAYHVATSGVLVIMQQLDGDNEWTIHVELSPAGWWEVSGFRYTLDPKHAQGSEGKVEASGSGQVRSV